jgi:hypothetical protein
MGCGYRNAMPLPQLYQSLASWQTSSEVGEIRAVGAYRPTHLSTEGAPLASRNSLKIGNPAGAVGSTLVGFGSSSRTEHGQKTRSTKLRFLA